MRDQPYKHDGLSRAFSGAQELTDRLDPTAKSGRGLDVLGKGPPRSVSEGPSRHRVAIICYAPAHAHQLLAQGV